MQSYYEPYFVSRRRKKTNGSRRRRHGNRGCGVLLVGVLILLCVAICFIIFVLPNLVKSEQTSTDGVYTKKFYFLVTATSSEYGVAYENAQVTAARGGAGCVYNDGKLYYVVAAVYLLKTEADAVVSVNDGVTVLEIELSIGGLSDNDRTALDYFCNDFFTTFSNSSAGLDRGTKTDAEADYECRLACIGMQKLLNVVDSSRVVEALEEVAEFNVTAARSVSSYIKYFLVKIVCAVKWASI